MKNSGYTRLIVLCICFISFLLFEFIIIEDESFSQEYTYLTNIIMCVFFISLIYLHFTDNE